MGWRVTRDAEEFWRATEPYLRAHRAASTIVLSIVDTLRSRGEGAYSGPPELAFWDPGDGVSGLVVHTPPYRPLVSTLSGAAAAAWAADHPRPERLLGPSDTVECLARAWGTEPEVVIAERLHRLDVLRPPVSPAPTRIAGDAERGLLWAWLQAFRDEAVPHDPPPARAPLDAAVDEGRVVVAVPDGEPVAYAAVSPSLLRTARIAPVYTPPAHRGRGYGAAVTAAVARIALERGDEEVLLLTDLANPTSSGLYARLGFVGIADIVDAVLIPVGQEPPIT